MEKKYENIYVKRFLYFNVYVIKGKNGDVLIDTGFIGIRRKLKKWLDKFNIKLVILTHAHVDHIWNAAYIKKTYNCDIAIGIDDIQNIDNSNIHAKPSNKKHRLWTKIMNLGMKLFNAPEFKIDLYLKNNQIIRRNGIKLKIISLPGHTDGSIGILYKDYLFAGDALVNRKKKVDIAYQNQDNELAKNSYETIFNFNPKMIFIGHDREIINNN